MNHLSISKEQFSDLVNLEHRVFYPLNHFVDKKSFLSIIKEKKVRNKFFTFPIFFGLNKTNYEKIKKNKIIDLYFKKKYLAKILIKNFFTLDYNFVGKKLFGKNYKKNPFFIKFKNENFIFLDFIYKKKFNKNLKYKNFVAPIDFKKKIKKNIKTSYLAGFHTRNVPHNAHMWIHQKMIKKFGALLIQPLIGQYKLNEYKEDVIINSNLKVIKLYNHKNVFFAPFFSYPRYGGPLEAALHAIVRRNYGCSHFWVGRDHAGYKNLYKIFDAQSFCKKNESKLKIKIVSENEPKYCKNCNIISNQKCNKKDCKKYKKIKISGSMVRSLLLKNRKIPKYVMNPYISSALNKQSLINKL